MAATRKQEEKETVKDPNAGLQFSREQIVASERYRGQRDLVSALLSEGERYTRETVDGLIRRYQEGKVE